MPICPHCGAVLDLSSRFNFCPSCEKQFRCLNCGEMTCKGASRCLVCGEPIVGAPSFRAANTYSYIKRETESESLLEIKLGLSDKGMSEFGQVFGGRLPFSEASGPDVSLLPRAAELPAEAVEEVQQSVEPSDGSRQGSDRDSVSARKWFDRQTNGTLVLRTRDLKGKTKKSQQERFAVLYAWAYPQLGSGKPPTEDDILSGMRKNGLHDSNFANYWGAVSGRYLVCIDERYELSDEGEKQIGAILEDIGNSELSGFRYWEKRKRSRKSTQLTDKEKSDVENWSVMPSRGEATVLSSLTSHRDQCLFIVYDLIRELGGTAKVKPHVAYAYLKKKYQTTSLTQTQFTRALANCVGARLQKTPEGEYYLGTEGEDQAKRWFDHRTGE